jgi:CRP-like cAMP-binding protein
MAQNTHEVEVVFNKLIDSNFFSRMQPSDLRISAKYFNISNYSEGETIFREGDVATFICFLHQGRVSVIKNDWNGDVVVMGTECAGDNFGEMAVLDGEPRSATCVAETDCEILTLTKKELDTLLKENAFVGSEILRAIAINLSLRMRFAVGRLVNHLEST